MAGSLSPPAPPALDPRKSEGMITRRLVVRAKDVAFLKGIVEAHEGIAQVFAESGGDLTIATPAGRDAELDELVADLAAEFDGIVSPAGS